MTDIYQRQELLDIYKNPANRGKIANATVCARQTNQMCGDELDLYLSINDERIIDAKFDGDACAVSVISASLVTEEIIGKTVPQAKKLTKKAVLDLIGVPLTTSRVKCATLVLEALQKALQTYEQK